MKRPTLVLALAFGTFLGCEGGTIGVQDETVDEADDAIIGGTTDTGDPAVGILYAEDGNTGWTCTASLISPTVVLTAAHCVEEASAAAKFYMYFGYDSNAAKGADWLTVKATHYDPQYRSSSLYSGHDVAVAILDKAVSTPPLPFNRTAMSQAMVGKAARLVGYGNNNGSAGTGAGTKRQTTTILNSYDSVLINVGQTGKTTCQGDSGGPTFMTVGGVETIVGVTSFGSVGCGGASYKSRVDAYSAWIDQYVPTGGGGGGGTPPPPPPPPVTCNWESEDNGTSTSADTLCADGHILGTIASATDVDWYTWTVGANKTYYVDLKTLPANYNMTLYKLLEDGSFYRVGTATANARANQQIARVTSTGGTYYLKVFGLNGASNAQSGYTVNVSTN